MERSRFLKLQKKNPDFEKSEFFWEDVEGEIGRKSSIYGKNFRKHAVISEYFGFGCGCLNLVIGARPLNQRKELSQAKAMTAYLFIYFYFTNAKSTSKRRKEMFMSNLVKMKYESGLSKIEKRNICVLSNQIKNMFCNTP